MRNSLRLLACQETGMRWAGESGRPLELAPDRCRDLAAELRQIHQDAAHLYAAAKLMRDSDRNPWPRSPEAAHARAHARKCLDDALAAFENGPTSLSRVRPKPL